jgi:hypothetical protein
LPVSRTDLRSLSTSATRARVLEPAGNQLGQLRRTFELVNHRQPGAPPSTGSILMREAGEALRRELRIHQHASGLGELAGRVRIDHLAVHYDVWDALVRGWSRRFLQFALEVRQRRHLRCLYLSIQRS